MMQDETGLPLNYEGSGQSEAGEATTAFRAKM